MKKLFAIGFLALTSGCEGSVFGEACYPTQSLVQANATVTSCIQQNCTAAPADGGVEVLLTEYGTLVGEYTCPACLPCDTSEVGYVDKEASR